MQCHSRDHASSKRLLRTHAREAQMETISTSQISLRYLFFIAFKSFQKSRLSFPVRLFSYDTSDLERRRLLQVQNPTIKATWTVDAPVRLEDQLSTTPCSLLLLCTCTFALLQKHIVQKPVVQNTRQSFGKSLKEHHSTSITGKTSNQNSIL
jgi:hypothetical protein